MKKLIVLFVISAIPLSFATTSTTSTKEPHLKKFIDRTSITLGTEYYGPKFEQFQNTEQVNTWNELKVKNKIASKTSIYASHVFRINQQNQKNSNDQNPAYTSLDPRLGIERKDKRKSGIAYKDRLMSEVGSSESSLDTNKSFRLRYLHTEAVTVNDLHTISASVSFRKWFYDDNKFEQNNPLYRAIVGAGYEYAISDESALVVDYILENIHQAKKEFLSTEKNRQEVIVGVDFSISKNISIMPAIFLKGASDKVNSGMNPANDTSLNLYLSATLF